MKNLRFAALLFSGAILLGMPACSCLSGPYYTDATHEMVYVRGAMGQARIPVYDLRFRVVESPDKLLITVSAAGWQVEGFGAGNTDKNSVMVYSVGGRREAGGVAKEMSVKKPPGSSPPVFYMDSLGTATRIR